MKEALHFDGGLEDPLGLHGGEPECQPLFGLPQPFSAFEVRVSFLLYFTLSGILCRSNFFPNRKLRTRTCPGMST